jgi:hypothetical protein
MAMAAASSSIRRPGRAAPGNLRERRNLSLEPPVWKDE